MLLGRRSRSSEHGSRVCNEGEVDGDDVGGSSSLEVHELSHRQGPAIRSIVEEAGRVRAAEGGGRYVVEQSPVGSSASNGVVERAILSVEQQVRVFKSAVEDRLGVKVGAWHSVVPWLVEYAVVLLNRMEVGKDGMTAFERCKGRRARTLGIEFGEGVLWKRKPIRGAWGKFSSMWDNGVYLGLRGASGEFIVSDVTGVRRTRTVQRKAAQDRWRLENVEFVRWVPWTAMEDDPMIDGERLEVTKMTKYKVEREKVEAEQKAPVRFMIKWEDLEKHGFTTRCPGCKAILRGTARQGRRARLTEAMKGEEEVSSWKNDWRRRTRRGGRRHRAADDGVPEQGRERKRRKEEDVGEEDMQIVVAELDVNL